MVAGAAGAAGAAGRPSSPQSPSAWPTDGAVIGAPTAIEPLSAAHGVPAVPAVSELPSLPSLGEDVEMLTKPNPRRNTL